MPRLKHDKNRRVLVIDDNCLIHDDFRKILSPAKLTRSALEHTEEALYGNSVKSVCPIEFEVDSAYQGQEGVLLCKGGSYGKHNTDALESQGFS